MTNENEMPDETARNWDNVHPNVRVLVHALEWIIVNDADDANLDMAEKALQSYAEHPVPDLAQPESAWRDISTAPRDGKIILAFRIVDDETQNWKMELVSWNAYREVGMGDSQWDGWPRYTPEPTHWQPLPAPPKARGGEGK